MEPLLEQKMTSWALGSYIRNIGIPFPYTHPVFGSLISLQTFAGSKRILFRIRPWLHDTLRAVHTTLPPI